MDPPPPAPVLRWLREDIGLASVLLTNLGLELPAKMQSNARAGDSVLVKVVSADAREDRLRVVEYDPDSVPQ